MRNRKVNRERFSALTIAEVWKKGKVVQGYNPDTIRKDDCGAWMIRTEYGNTDSKYGWEIDHVKPVAKGGSDALANLQPLQWQNNRHKSDDYPRWYCKVAA